MKEKVDISVAILTKNVQMYLPKLLDKIFSQDINERFEVICVDSSSAKEVSELCRSYPVRIFKIKPESFNHGLTRNFAISQTKGEFIIFLTQDAIPYDENWMKTLVDAMREDERIAGVYCRQIPRDTADLLTKKYVNSYLTARDYKVVNFIEDPNKYQQLSAQEKYFLCNFDNVCSCIRKSVWRKYNFEAVDFGEDITWAKKILKAGYKIVYTPKTRVFHSHNRGFIYEFRRHYLNSKQLYEEFSFGLASNLTKAVGILLFYTLKDSFYLLKNAKSLKENILFFKLPFLSIFRVSGQYWGIREAKKKLRLN